MKSQSSSKQGTITALTLAATCLIALSVFFFTRLDIIVNSDLYHFGLQYSVEWFTRYEWFYQFSLALCIVAISTALTSGLFTRRYFQKHNGAFRSISLVLLLVTISAISLSAFFFEQLDRVVHVDLYHYGLQFSNVWATKYWAYVYFMLALQVIVVILIVVASAMIYLSPKKLIRISPTKPIALTLLIAGFLSILLSIVYDSSISAFIGLGLVFWGGILAYIRSDEDPAKKILYVLSTSPFSTLNELFRELNYEGDTIYLPPKYLKNPETNKVCILKQKNDLLPSPEELQKEEDIVLAKNPVAIVLTPPGDELTKMFERILRKNFAQVDLEFVIENVPRLFVQDFMIAENVKISVSDKKVDVTIENIVFGEMLKDLARNSESLRSLGTSLSSSFGCILAKATGKPVRIRSDRVSDDAKTVFLEYDLVDETKQEHV